MKRLPERFTKKGFVHEQVIRRGDIAIYKRWEDETPFTHFEVIRVGRHEGYDIAGKHIEAAETYPPSTQWGISAFTFQTIEAATAKMEKMEANDLKTKQPNQ